MYLKVLWISTLLAAPPIALGHVGKVRDKIPRLVSIWLVSLAVPYPYLQPLE
jgi:hypothetical protein